LWLAGGDQSPMWTVWTTVLGGAFTVATGLLVALIALRGTKATNGAVRLTHLEDLRQRDLERLRVERDAAEARVDAVEAREDQLRAQLGELREKHTQLRIAVRVEGLDPDELVRGLYS
jgi:hypothetical protein